MAVTSPAFQFYAAEYLADEHVQVMSLEEEGIYIRLMAYCWREGSIPSDMDKLSRLIGKGGSTSSISVVLERFNQHPTEEGRMVHSRLEKERQKQAKWREKSSEGGKKSAEARSQKPKNENKRRVVEPKPNQSAKGGDTLQSSSSSSSSIESKENIKRNPGEEGLFANLPPAEPQINIKAEFDRLYQLYPEHKGRKAALIAFEKVIKTKGSGILQKIEDAILAYKKFLIATPTRSAAHFSTWLNGDRWEDNNSVKAAGLPQQAAPVLPPRKLMPKLRED
jgi:uncharacterized protein YdaU (DUF1376 family)